MFFAVIFLPCRWVSAHANIRVASAARRSYGEALVICFRGGAFSAVLDITLCVGGVTLLYVALYTRYVLIQGVLDETDVPVLMVGYGFGASFVALFMQVRIKRPLLCSHCTCRRCVFFLLYVFSESSCFFNCYRVWHLYVSFIFISTRVYGTTLGQERNRPQRWEWSIIMLK